MRPLVLLVALVLVGCGEDTVWVPEETPAPAGGGGAAMSCIDGVLYDGTLYAGTMAGELPPAGEPLEGGKRPACNDTGGATEPDQPASLTAVGGLPPEVAVYDADRPGLIYTSSEHFVFLGLADSPAAKGKACTATGAVKLPLEVDGHPVTVLADTRFTGFERSSVPYLGSGDRIAVRGVCAGRDLFAREIALQLNPQPAGSARR